MSTASGHFRVDQTWDVCYVRLEPSLSVPVWRLTMTFEDYVKGLLKAGPRRMVMVDTTPKKPAFRTVWTTSTNMGAS